MLEDLAKIRQAKVFNNWTKQQYLEFLMRIFPKIVRWEYESKFEGCWFVMHKKAIKFAKMDSSKLNSMKCLI